MEDFVLIGIVRKVRNNKGDLKVEPMSDVPSRYSSLTRVFVRRDLKDPALEKLVEKCAPVNGYVVLKLEGVDSFTAAEDFVGSQILVPESERAELPAGTFYIDALIGMNVLNNEGNRIGTVDDVRSSGQRSLLVRRDDGKEFILPFVREFVKDVNVGAKTIVVELIEGIMEGETDED
ncbi:MAG TPA: ribosome maturation factor RimM [Candidatus Kryptonia bacterium]